ncbi:hypothetical protein [Sanyastnella coralliicola]|uniref:hypothetical protein n=1 Tax=Sanyastnella coralliicola TaxID=3069118 RepID=UPI0027BA7B2E|nr:hypothetical protein [Longitalea sp. SCSIO 12813]
MIYNIAAKTHSSINLFRLDENTFSILKYDEFALLMTGFDYTIINQQLVSVFDELMSNELEIRPIRILRRVTNEKWDEFFELIVKEHIDIDKIKIVDENERSVWQFDHHLFVSESMKNKIERKFEGEFEFSEGFSHFG